MQNAGLSSKRIQMIAEFKQKYKPYPKMRSAILIIWLSVLIFSCNQKNAVRDIKNIQFKNACFNLELLNSDCNKFVCVLNHSKDTTFTKFKNTSFSYELYSFENYRGFNILSISVNLINKKDTLEACFCREAGKMFDTFIYFENGEKAVEKTFSIFDKKFPIDQYHSLVKEGTWLNSKAYQYYLHDNIDFYNREVIFKTSNVSNRSKQTTK